MIAQVKLRTGQTVWQHLRFEDRLAFIPLFLLEPNLDLDSLLPKDALIIEAIKASARKYATLHDHKDHDFAKSVSEHLDDIYNLAIKPKLRNLDRTNVSHRTILRNVRNFRRAARSINCTRCAKAKENICLGRAPAKDDEIIRNDGECFRLFFALFHCIQRHVDQKYSQELESFQKAPDTTVVFKTLPSTGRNIRAETRILDTKGSDHWLSHVELSIPVESCNADELFSLPYKLVHELAIHSVQAIQTDISTQVRRPNYGEDCVFTEGLLDGAAYQIAKEMLQKNDQWPQYWQRFLPRFLSTIELDHGLRKDHSQPTMHASARQARATGHKIYDQLVIRYGDEKTIASLLATNIAALSPDDREQLAEDLYPLIHKPSKLPNKVLDAMRMISLLYNQAKRQASRADTLLEPL